MKVYNYPNNTNIFAIDVSGQIYNYVIHHTGSVGPFIKGGIVITDGDSTDPEKIKFPDDVLMDASEYEATDICQNGVYAYDSDVWTYTGDQFILRDSDPPANITPANITPEKTPELTVTSELNGNIKEIMQNVERIKNLYKTDDEVIQKQWFMTDVDFTNFIESTETKDREKTIFDSIQNIVRLIKTPHFKINNIYQMKLLFQILFNPDTM